MNSTRSCVTFSAGWQGVVSGCPTSYVARMVINLWIPADPVLAAIAPLGLGAVAGTALVVDADPDGPRYPGEGSLAALVAAGPRRSDLSPTHAGMAVLRNGGVELDEAADVLAALAAGWPSLVVRHASSEPPAGHSVAVVADLPGALARRVNGPTVIQRCARASSSMNGDVQLPRPSTRLVRSLLEGRMPGPSRWIRAWKPVWGMAE